jgi:ubiquitin-conjugating enzyme E2 I
VTVKQILLGIQEWYNAPNALSPAHGEAYSLFTTDRAAYDKRVREQAKKIAALATAA